MLIGIACTAIFVVTVFMGEIVGFAIEALVRRRWRSASHRIGFGFDARRVRIPSLSRMMLHSVVGRGAEETIFSYGESLNKLSGTIKGFEVLITDFAVWNYFTRCPLVFRGVLCVIKGNRLRLPGQIRLVKWYSHLVDGFRLSKTFRQFKFPHESGFSGCYALFGKGGFAPWIFTPDLRDYVMDHRKEIDCVWVNEDEVVILWVDRNPDRFGELIDLGLGIASRLADDMQGGTEVASAETA
jgi:hypothetical protein